MNAQDVAIILTAATALIVAVFAACRKSKCTEIDACCVHIKRKVSNNNQDEEDGIEPEPVD